MTEERYALMEWSDAAGTYVWVEGATAKNHPLVTYAQEDAHARTYRHPSWLLGKATLRLNRNDEETAKAIFIRLAYVPEEGGAP